MLIVLIVLLFGFGSNDCQYAPYKMWVYVETGYYAFNILFVYIYFKVLKVRGREDFRFMVANCVLNVIHSAWLIYGNVIYFKYNI